MKGLIGNIISFAGRYDDVRQVLLEGSRRSSDTAVTEFIGGVDDCRPKNLAYGGAQQYEPSDFAAREFDHAGIASTVPSDH